MFSRSVYIQDISPSYPAKYLKYVTRYCLAVNCVFVIISTNTEINGRLFSSKIHENSHLDFSTTNSPIFHITRPKITFREVSVSVRLVVRPNVTKPCEFWALKSTSIWSPLFVSSVPVAPQYPRLYLKRDNLLEKIL